MFGPGVHMFSWIRIGALSILFSSVLVLPIQAQSAEQVEVGPPPLHRAEPPAPGATPEELEQRGDELRMEKNFLDAMDYYHAALKSATSNAPLFNKIGICELMMQRYRDARRSFERSIKSDPKHSDAYNNLGVTYYATHNYGGAIKHYEKAISLNNEAASYFSNLGTAYFGKKQFEKAIQCYAKAVQIDPEIFDRSSHSGVQAKLPSPEDRAHYDYVLAKMFARNGIPDRSLHYLKKALEEGYKDIKDVYKDNEFSSLRKDPRFTELMASKTTAISD
jgi:tetratricopeptide (TPR) repeat protein